MQLVYSRDELTRSHPYARPHEAAGYRLHGGFTAEGEYVSPRTLVRWPAVHAWEEALRARGGEVIDSSRALLKLGSYPNKEQQKILLANGLGQSFWNTLTITGIVEARGRALAQFTAPDLQKIVVEDLSQTACGHLNTGLLWAHGVDEGGDPADANAPGAHDQMWFAVRDLVFGKGAYKDPEPPASISRPVAGREMPDLPEGYEQVIKFLMNVLMIEVRAETLFALCVDLFRDPDAFTDRRAEAEQAAVMVERIRTDEQIHISYLALVISELRASTLRAGGKQIPGAKIIDPVWERMVHWHGYEERALARERSRANVAEQAKEKLGAKAAAMLAAFDAAEI